MPDKISLEINGKRIEHFISYRIESNLYVADNAFSIEIANPEISINTGMPCKLFVNNEIELTGIIDRQTTKCDKSGRSLIVEGRDLMGILVDSYCEEFMDVKDKTLSELTELLIGPDEISGRPPIPFISRKSIIYQENLRGRLNTHRRHRKITNPNRHPPLRSSRTSPGMTIFEALRTYALSQGMLFYCLPDGTFEFGRPLTGGASEYSIILNKNGIGNNVLSGEKEEDISKCYSKVVVMGQRQGEKHTQTPLLPSDASNEDQKKYNETLLLDPNGIGYQAIIEDNTFPFYKAYVACDNNDSQNPLSHARLIMEKMRHDGFKLVYKLPRHSQNGRNYTVNKLAYVKDNINNVDGTYLIYGRTFLLDKQIHLTSERTSRKQLFSDQGPKSI